MRLILALALLGATLSLGGCGQKGPLYLPDDPTPQQQR
jgi:predicted small lipoprotein YifL